MRFVRNGRWDLAKLMLFYQNIAMWTGNSLFRPENRERISQRLQNFRENENRSRGLGFDKPLLTMPRLPLAERIPSPLQSLKVLGTLVFTGTFIWADSERKASLLLFLSTAFTRLGSQKLLQFAGIREALQDVFLGRAKEVICNHSLAKCRISLDWTIFCGLKCIFSGERRKARKGFAKILFLTNIVY